MGRRRTSNMEGRGRLTVRPGKDEGLVPRTLEFIRSQLVGWRDDPHRPKGSNEKELNSTLCDFLAFRSRELNPMVHFKHESPQTDVHSVDIGVHGIEQQTLIGTLTYSIYQPFLVIEAKRLPIPTKDREREYVTGSNSGKPTGGIQRFKLGLHGSMVASAVMVGYIENKSPAHWHRTINQWISELAGTTAGSCVWAASESLQALECDDALGTAATTSAHSRTSACATGAIDLRHLWVVMNHTSK